MIKKRKSEVGMPNAEVRKPGVGKSEGGMPNAEVMKPGVGKSEVGMSNAEVMKPGVGKSEGGMPNAEVMKPGVGKSGGGMPNAEVMKPGVGKSEVGNPRSESPKKRVRNKEPGIKKLEEETHSAFDIPQSALQELQTENMEVHHHPDLHHEKKPWKEYLLEGLMIFLAVTMGFFAESLREHINEKKRAQDFAVTLYADLKADTAEMRGYLRYHKIAVANIDTLMQLLSDNDPKQVPPAKLYWFGLWGGAFKVFIPHDATLTEMKNSGTLRFFANLGFNSKLEQYDQLCQNLKSFENLSTGTYTEVRKYRAQLFNFKYNAVINNISAIKDTRLRRMKVDSFLKTNPPLLNTDKVLFNQYVEMVRSRFLDRDVLMGTDILNHADSLIVALKKKYDVEEE